MKTPEEPVEAGCHVRSDGDVFRAIQPNEQLNVGDIVYLPIWYNRRYYRATVTARRDNGCDAVSDGGVFNWTISKGQHSNDKWMATPSGRYTCEGVAERVFKTLFPNFPMYEEHESAHALYEARKLFFDAHPGHATKLEEILSQIHQYGWWQRER